MRSADRDHVKLYPWGYIGVRHGRPFVVVQQGHPYDEFELTTQDNRMLRKHGVCPLRRERRLA
jgi:hypothetical protein